MNIYPLHASNVSSGAQPDFRYRKSDLRTHMPLFKAFCTSDQLLRRDATVFRHHAHSLTFPYPTTIFLHIFRLLDFLNLRSPPHRLIRPSPRRRHILIALIDALRPLYIPGFRIPQINAVALGAKNSRLGLLTDRLGVARGFWLAALRFAGSVVLCFADAVRARPVLEGVDPEILYWGVGFCSWQQHCCRHHSDAWDGAAGHLGVLAFGHDCGGARLGMESLFLARMREDFVNVQ